MFLIIAVLAILSAAFLLLRFAKRHDPELPDPKQYSFEPPPNARSLFAPSEEDFKREADEQKAREIARREFRAKAESRAAVDRALLAWRDVPDGRNAAELLHVAAESGLAGDFSRAAEEIVTKFHESSIDGLTNSDLAALLDSHIQLLPDSDRSSGAVFWLKQEAARLRLENNIVRQ